MQIRAWKYRLYPTKQEEEILNQQLYECKNLWNRLLGYTRDFYEKTRKFPNREELYLQTKSTPLFSQVAQNIADRLYKSIRLMISKKKAGQKAGFPRFKCFERMKSFTYPQSGFKLFDKEIHLSKIGRVEIRKHRELSGKIKTLTIKKSPSGKWFAIFVSEIESIEVPENTGPKVGIDLGIEYFAYLSNGKILENPRNLKNSEEKLAKAQKRLSKKKKGSKNRKKAKRKVAIIHEKITNQRRDFLHKVSRQLVNSYSLIALENLNVSAMSRGFLAKGVLDCGFSEFTNLLHYKAEEAGSEIRLVNPAYTTSTCSNCGLIKKKSLSERWHSCVCGAELHRDHNAANNILSRALGVPGERTTAGLVGSRANVPVYGTEARNACREEISTAVHPERVQQQQIPSKKQETSAF